MVLQANGVPSKILFWGKSQKMCNKWGFLARWTWRTPGYTDLLYLIFIFYSRAPKCATWIVNLMRGLGVPFPKLFGEQSYFPARYDYYHSECFTEHQFGKHWPSKLNFNPSAGLSMPFIICPLNTSPFSFFGILSSNGPHAHSSLYFFLLFF